MLTVVSGSRRCGKSTLIREFVDENVTSLKLVCTWERLGSWAGFEKKTLYGLMSFIEKRKQEFHLLGDWTVVPDDHQCDVNCLLTKKLV